MNTFDEKLLASAIKIASLLEDQCGVADPTPERAVLVTTDRRGVFFGYLRQAPGAQLTLHRARNCIYWSRAMRGFLGLATTGPDEACKIGPAAESLYLTGVTSIAECTAAAVERWESAPWA